MATKTLHTGYLPDGTDPGGGGMENLQQEFVFPDQGSITIDGLTYSDFLDEAGVYPAREDVSADLWGKPVVSGKVNTRSFEGPPQTTKFRYSEDDFLKEVLEYIGTTYQGHYVGKEELQTTDVWDTLGSAATTTRDTAIKYLMRYGKKEGYNKKDLLKAVHYIVLLAHFTKDD